MTHRAESGRETVVFIVIVGGGIIAGLASKNLVSLFLVALILGVLLNGYLLVRAPLKAQMAERVPVALVGAFPAGLYDALKIVATGLVVRWGTASLEEFPAGRSMWVLVVQVAVFLVAFLLELNDFLRGSNKAHIDAFLIVLLLVLLLTTFVVFGWKIGLVSLALTFFYCAFSRPLAARLAARLYGAMRGGPSGGYLGLPPRALERISRELGRHLTVGQMVREILAGRDRHQKASEALLDYCEADPTVRQVMREFQASRESLTAVYWRLVADGAGQWRGGHYVAASALAYPHTLRYLLEHPAHGRYQPMEIVCKLLDHFERGTPLG